MTDCSSFVCRCKQWVVQCGREDLLSKDAAYLYKNYVLCADHFEPSQFVNAEQRNKLVWNALPSFIAAPNSQTQLISERRLASSLSRTFPSTTADDVIESPSVNCSENHYSGIMTLGMKIIVEKSCIRSMVIGAMGVGVWRGDIPH